MDTIFRFVLVLSMLLIEWETVHAQKELKPVTDDATTLLGDLAGSKNKIEKATLTKEDERSITASLRFVGFEDKEYQLQIAALDSRKEVIESITKVEIDMPKSKQADITLLMSDPQKTMNQATLTSKFLRVRVGPKTGGIGGILEDTFEDLNLSTTEFLFEMDKKWMLMGANVKMAIKLTPYKNAGLISPN